MYQPEHFRVDDVAQMHALIHARPFATLVSMGEIGLYASHLPTVLREEGQYGVIEFHLARANPHCQELGEAGEALMIFQGPEGYITPNWYHSKAQHGKVVPTWNYAVGLRRHLGELTTQQENGATRPWQVSDAPKAYVDSMLRAIVGFRFAITRS